MSAPAIQSPLPARQLRDVCLILALIVVVLTVVPPLSVDSRNYVFAESIQFALLALCVPALVVLGAPLERWSRARVGRWPAGGNSSDSSRGWLSVTGRLLVFFAATILWRTPIVVDALVRIPALVAAEFATFLVVGVALWSQLVASPPLLPKLRSGQRIVPATVAMWMIWILAYFVGFSHSSWYPAIHHVHSALSLVADQELATGVLWAAAAAAFVPVVFVNLIRFLRPEV
ncbi:MAG TPA: cytochrome c oxidase assembly protein, partial [Acidimicrobiales bacterium]|nr:cytochrome c oxidase assembly protein [Acidimicrobiales bacterium]